MNNEPSHHISHQFDEELNEVKTLLLEMGGLVQRQLKQATEGLIESNSEKAEKVLRDDDRVNEMEVNIDSQCATILALRQPAASDLRLVISIMKTITDLERIGDESCKIAKQAIELINDGAKVKSGYLELSNIGKQVTVMLRAALDAFARLDVDMALDVARKDKEVDAVYGVALRSMAVAMRDDPDDIDHMLNVMWSLRALERIGDHARNIAEYVIYVAKGKDVRHLGVTKMTDEVNAIRK